MSTVNANPSTGAPPHEPIDTHNGGHDGDGGDEHIELPHLPPPSVRPLYMAIGLMIVGFGLVYLTTPPLGLILVLLGLAIFGFGLGGWIYDDVRAVRAAQQGGGGHH